MKSYGDFAELKENGANEKQLLKFAEIFPRLQESKYYECKPYCHAGYLNIYFTGGFIEIDPNGKVKINSRKEFIKKEIEGIISK